MIRQIVLSCMLLFLLTAAPKSLANFELLVNSQNNTEILRYSQAGGTPLTPPFASDPELQYVSGLVIGPTGNLYVSLHANDSISEYNINGTRLGTFAGGEPGSGPGIQSGIKLDGPSKLAFDDSTGHLYVVSSHNSTVVHYDETGAYVESLVVPGIGLVGIEFGSNGDMYVSSSENNEIYKWNGSSFDVLISAGPEGLDKPYGLEFSGGYLYVASYGTNQILRYTSTGVFNDVFASSPQLDRPFDLAFGPDDRNLFVVSPFVDGVLWFDGASGASLGNFGTGDGLDGPNGIAFIPEPATLLLFGLGTVIIRKRR